ncbi:hypothetical protein [Conexibacter sp. S30A1]|uniref:hypothetical protein n=1 Tax=Conexibacter sp. S30A1 TaxID=2937800 RepID=UPI00200E8F43|nr:hypothetical protein [Conexibacter sp. S30A1]
MFLTPVDRCDQTTSDEPPEVSNHGPSTSVVPEVLFEEARQRRRRRWMAGGTLAAAAFFAATLILGNGGGAGRGSVPHADPSGAGSGASAGHVSDPRLFPGAPPSETFYTGPGSTCALAPRSRYLPPWSGCVTARIADVLGNGREDLVLTYSRLAHTSVGTQPATRDHGHRVKLFRAERAMLRLVLPDGRMLTTPISYTLQASTAAKPMVERVPAAAIVGVAHIGATRGEQILLRVQQISSGSTAIVYTPYRGGLVSAGALLAYGGDSGAQAGFQCVAGNPPRLVAHLYALLHGIRILHGITIYGRWRETSITYAWRGPRLAQISSDTRTSLLAPSDTIGAACLAPHSL